MSADYIAGILTVLSIPVAGAVVWMLYTLAHRLWRALHSSMRLKIELRPDPISFEQLVGDADDTTTYQKAIKRFATALGQSPKIIGFRALGWYVVAVRDYETKGDPDV